MTLSPQTLQQIDYLARDLAQMFTPPELIVGCEVMSIADADEYDTNNGWIEAVVGRHNQQRCRWKGQFNVQVGDYVDVLYFASYRLFVVMGQGGTGAITPPGGGAWAAPGVCNLWDVSLGTVTPYASIQDAHDDAAAGDVLVVGGGEWGETLTISKAVYVVGVGRPKVTSSGADEITVTISASGAVWDGIDIETTSTSGDPRALKLTAGATVRNCRVNSSTGGDTTGYAIEIDNCAPTLENVVSLGYDYSLYSHNGSTTRNVIMAGGNYSGGIGTNVEIGNNFVINALRDPVIQGNISYTGNGRLDGVIKSSPGYGPQILGNSIFYFGGVAFDGVVTGAGGGASFPGSDTKFLTEASLDDLAKIQHIIDGGHPANPYPTTPNADDAEFNNSEQSENNTIGTHAGGDFWEWSPGAPAVDDINSLVLNCLYIQKNAADSGTDRYLGGAISSIGADDVYWGEIVVLPVSKQAKSGSYLALKLIDTLTGYYIRVKLEDHATNGMQVVTSYDNGSGETTVVSTIIGNKIPMCILGLRRYESGGNAFGRFYFSLGGLPQSSHFLSGDSVAVQNVSAKANFVPDEIRLEIHNASVETWAIDNYRRVA